MLKGRRPVGLLGELPHGRDGSKYALKGYRLRKLLLGLVICIGILMMASMVEWSQHVELQRTQDAGEPRGEDGLRQILSVDEEEDPRSIILETSEDGYDVGYIITPRIPKGPRTKDDGYLHIIFSSGCNYYQHWQSELLLASAARVGQRGRITRIVSGCHDKAAETVRHTHQTFPEGKGDKLVSMETLKKSLNADFGLFITPSFEEARNFPWVNKPNSIKYFMEHAREELDRYGEQVIVILDPDFIFLKPLTQFNTDPTEIITSRGADQQPGNNVPIDRVKKGRPVAQRYGLEGSWVEKFDVAEITGDPNSPALRYTRRQAAKTNSVGPPLMLHVDDLTDLSKLWAQYMMPVLHRDADILADMWAYSIGASHLGLDHTQLDQYMISAHGTTGQAYKWIDEWETYSCDNPHIPPGKKIPTFLHMASNFKGPDRKKGPWMFHKGHVPPEILDCDIPLLLPPPDDLPQQVDPTDRKSRQHVWIICQIYSNLNDMLLRYKQKFCTRFDDRKLIRPIQQKTRDKGCSPRASHWCFPLAQIEGIERYTSPDAIRPFDLPYPTLVPKME